MSLLRRRMMMARMEEEEMAKEWQTIVDTITTEELPVDGEAFIFESMPDGTPIQGRGFREVAIYYKYNANNDGAKTGYIRAIVTGTNGKKTSAQTIAGLPSTGYRRGYFNVELGTLFNIWEVQSSGNSSMSAIGFYDVQAYIDEVKVIRLFAVGANVGTQSEIKIMGR